MPKSRRPRRAYRQPNFAREAQEHAWGTYTDNVRPNGDRRSAVAHPGADELRGIFGRLKDEAIDKDPPAPAHTRVTHSTAPPRAPRGRGRYVVPVAAGGAVIGGGAYLAHRRRRNAVVKGLVDPLTGDAVVIEKRYPIGDEARGILVAKASPASAVRRAGRFVRSMDPPSHRKQGALAGGATMYGYDRMTGGSDRRKAFRAHLSSPAGNKQWERAFDSGDPRHGLAFDRGVDATVVRHNRARRSKEEAKLHKRDDETALTHVGSRRGGRTPVSSVRTAGLPVQSASFSQGHPWERPGTSHANKHTHVHTKVKARRDGKLFELHRSRRSVSGSSVGKAFAQVGGSGRRIRSAY